MRLVLRLAALALACALAACDRGSPEQRLRGQMAGMQQALEERRSADFMDGVAADFAGPGGIDRAALQQVVRAQVLANANVGLTLGPAQVELQGDRATVRFSALSTGGSGRFLPERARAWDVTSGWREEDGQWRLYYAEWRPK
ncbi:nuclear transport factor 2 family protein [Pseudoxanthomonas sp. 10H]|uniref:nuclear transport factor 2 family protein n=1 Tax=Pseudoxanthomonas sp. 10H TaxID=3242729 RepID=UPI003556D934